MDLINAQKNCNLLEKGRLRFAQSLNDAIAAATASVPPAFPVRFITFKNTFRRNENISTRFNNAYTHYASEHIFHIVVYFINNSERDDL